LQTLRSRQAMAGRKDKADGRLAGIRGRTCYSRSTSGGGARL
jgi:hypothetical protein